MKKNELDFIEITRRAITNTFQQDDIFAETDWNEIHELSRINKLNAIVFDVVKNQTSIPEELKKSWDKERFLLFVRQKKTFHDLGSIVAAFDVQAIDYVVFKGCVLAALYPNSGYRVSSDTDILVPLEQRDKAIECLFSMGFEIFEAEGNDAVTVLANYSTGHKIELHTSLFEDYSGDKISIIEGFELASLDKCIKVDIEGTQIRTLGVSEHLVYQIFHMVKHFILNGGEVRFFTDIALFVNAYIAEIDMSYFWECMDKLGYSSFVENFFAICIKFYNMDSKIMEGRQSKADPLALECMHVDFIYNGDISQIRDERFQFIGVMSDYLTGDKVTKSTRSAKIKYVFPSVDELPKERYEYARKLHILLPIAWVHRAIDKLIETASGKSGGTSEMTTKMNALDARISLMANVGLIDNE